VTTPELRELIKASVKVAEDGTVTIPGDVMAAMQRDAYRARTMSTVPSTRANLQRNVGGSVDRTQGSISALDPIRLRWMRDSSPLIQAIHAARRTQVARMSRRWTGRPGDVGWRVVHKDHTDPLKQAPESIKPYIDRFTEILERPAPGYGQTSTASMMTLLEEDLLTLNRPVIEPLYHFRDTSRIVGLRAVDGGIIWPTLDWLQRWRQGKKIRDDDLFSNASQAFEQEMTSIEYVLVRDGIPQAFYPTGRLIVGSEQTRTDVRFAGWPPSRMEEALRMVTAQLDAWEYNHSFFTRGMLAELILTISPDTSEEDIQAFMDMLREGSQGVARAHQPLVMPAKRGEIEKIDLKANNTDMMFGSWASMLIALACAVYRMDPSTINANPWDGGNSPSLSAPNRHMEIALAKEEGLQHDLQHITDAMLNEVARRCHPDLRVLWEYGDYDPKKAAEIAEIEVRTNTTVNESRLKKGDPPLGVYLDPEKYKTASDEDREKHDRNPYNHVANPQILAILDKQWNPPPTPVAPDEPGDLPAPSSDDDLTKGADHGTIFMVRDIRSPT
jgi:hypothetical protein